MADIAFPYGAAQSGWQPLIGDWNGDAKDSAGFFIYNANHFFLRDAFTAGMADYSFAMGEANKGWRPLVGNWRGPTSQTLMAADGIAATVTHATLIDATVVQPVLDAALARWSELGISQGAIQIVVTDLPGAMLGQVAAQTIYLDRDAAGHGWFIDSTPALDEEFAAASGRNDLLAMSPAAVDRIDLLTVVEHELGHIAGLDDLDATLDGLMCAKLPTGTRRTCTNPR
jgi:hypothetical protein